jgi:hypothetical protein
VPRSGSARLEIPDAAPRLPFAPARHRVPAHVQRATRPRDRIGRHDAWIFVALVPLLHLASALGPPPPSVTALAWMAAVLPWPLLLLTAWFDRHRAPAPRPA